ALPALAGRGHRRGPGRRDPRAHAAAALLQTAGGVPAAGHVRDPDDPRGRDAVRLGPIPALRDHALREDGEHERRRVDLSPVQPAGDRHRRPRRRLPLGADLPDQLRDRPSGHLAGHAPRLGAGREREPGLRAGLHHRLLHGGAGRRDHRSQPVGGAGDGRRRAGPLVHRGGGRRARQPGGGAVRGVDRGGDPGDRHHRLSRDRVGGAVPDRGGGAPRAARGPLRQADMSEVPIALRPAATRSPLRIALWGVPIAVLLALLPYAVDPYQTILLGYGLTYAIAVLGFNLLLGYTGLLSFGHSAYFGVGAYTVALMVKYLGVTSMEAYLGGAIIACVLVTAIFGFACVRYTRIFFGILTMALSQVLWSLAFKFFWVTGGTDGLRVPTPTLLGVVTGSGDKIAFLATAYYYYVLAVFIACVA